MAARRHHTLLSVGAAAPDFRLPRLEGGDAALRDLIATGPALLAFFKISCPVCQFTLPILDRIHTPGRLAIYAISQNNQAETRYFHDRFKVALPTLLDREENGFAVSNAFGISSVPTLFLIETDGTISRVVEGWARHDVEQLAHTAGVAPFRQGENVPQWKAG